MSWGLDSYILTVAAVLGLVMGSFCNAWAWRLVAGESISKGRSHCTVCGHGLTAGDLVPVVSWLLLRRRCRYCGAQVSPRYPLVEVLTALLFVTLVLRFDLSWQLVQYAILGCLLLVISLVDLDSWIIPDGLLVAALVCYLPLAWLIHGNWLVVLGQGLIGGVSVALPLLLFVLVADRVMGKETMGGGDIKLFFVIGCYLGPGLTFLNLLLACFIGIFFQLCYGRQRADSAFPFGPAIALGTWLTTLIGAPVISWYLQFL